MLGIEIAKAINHVSYAHLVAKGVLFQEYRSNLCW